MNQPLPSKDERIVSANPYPDAAITGHSDGAIRGQTGSSIAVAANNAGYQLNAYPSIEHYYYGGYDNSSGGWGGYPQYAGADGLQVHPVMYGDNSALGLHSVYGFNSQMTYGQYSPVSTPVPHVVVDNQIFSPQQAPFSPSYYPQAVASSMPLMSATGTVSQDSMSYKGNHSVESGSNVNYYNLHGMYGGGEPLLNTSNHAELSQRTISPMTSTGPYAQSIGAFGSYDLNVAHASQQSQVSGYGLPSDFLIGRYAYDASNQNSTFAYPPSPQPAFDHPGQLYLEKGRNHREQVPTSVVSGDHNRGPRALKVKVNSNTESGAVSGSGKLGAPISGVQVESFNRSDLPAEPENAKFFIIKSFSEDNVHRSIKYGVWASTLHGNRKLDDAYRQAEESGNCPVYLFFSVNASSQFCGVAEMVGPLDFEKNADHWQQDRWNGQFPVIWHILKDVPNSKFRHILLENNDNKPVTHSRDSQEVELEHGIEMLKIFKEHEATTSILDDFGFYDERERLLQERKNRQVGKSKSEAPESINASIVNDMSDKLDQALQLEDDKK